MTPIKIMKKAQDSFIKHRADCEAVAKLIQPLLEDWAEEVSCEYHDDDGLVVGVREKTDKYDPYEFSMDVYLVPAHEFIPYLEKKEKVSKELFKIMSI
jgi:ADP-glucose pyrophosphorylase